MVERRRRGQTMRGTGEEWNADDVTWVSGSDYRTFLVHSWALGAAFGPRDTCILCCRESANAYHTAAPSVCATLG